MCDSDFFKMICKQLLAKLITPIDHNTIWKTASITEAASDAYERLLGSKGLKGMRPA